jgi:hypothetical protein
LKVPAARLTETLHALVVTGSALAWVGTLHQ